jgi:hypothetical protein
MISTTYTCDTCDATVPNANGKPLGWYTVTVTLTSFVKGEDFDMTFHTCGECEKAAAGRTSYRAGSHVGMLLVAAMREKARAQRAIEDEKALAKMGVKR